MTASFSEQTAYNHFVQKWGSATLNIVEISDREWQNSAAKSYRNHLVNREIPNLWDWFNFSQRTALIKTQTLCINLWTQDYQKFD